MDPISARINVCREDDSSYVATQPTQRIKQNLELQKAISAQPPLCECARFEKRALSWAVWLPGVSQNSWLDRVNKEFSHEHIIFEATKDNFGFGPHGYFEENLSDYSYAPEEQCYDGTKMRRILANLNPADAYGFFSNNCQRFAESIKSLYAKFFA